MSNATVFVIGFLGGVAVWIWRRAAAEERAKKRELYRKARAEDRRERYRWN